MSLTISSNTDTTVTDTTTLGANLSTLGMPIQAGTRSRGPVPYITAWSTEELESSAIVHRGIGIGYADETMADRDHCGVLWERWPSLPGRGRPMFGQVHSLRQRRVMRKLLCSVCAGRPDRNDRGMLWLLRDYRQDWPGWPNGMGVVEPPVCASCARYAVRACPALRKGWVAVRVGHSAIAGVYGIRYQAAFPRPVPVEDVTVTFDDPAIHWTLAGQLGREISQCVIVELESLEGSGQ